jgi:peptidoglycan/LPS O-acetylase OafA/YrhL
MTFFSAPAMHSPERRYVASLTGLRGLAAFAVFLYHFGALNPGIRLDLRFPLIGEVLQFPLSFGFAGVDVFFVLSGFLLTLPFARAALAGAAQPPLRRYVERRLLRVFPAYYAQLAIILALGSWFLAWKPQTVWSLTAHLFMFFNIGWRPVQPMVGIWWTLPVELGFYLLLPFLRPFLSPARWLPTLLAGVLLSMLYRYWAATHFGPAGGAMIFLAASQLPGSLTEFLMGSTAALLAQFMALRQRPAPAAWCADLMFVLGILLALGWLDRVVMTAADLYWLGHWSMIVAPLALGLPLALTTLALYWGSRIGRLLLANRLVYFLGLISYSLYLWHFVVLQQLPLLLGDTYQHMGYGLRFPLAAAAVICTAAVSYYVFERPFYRLKADGRAASAPR